VCVCAQQLKQKYNTQVVDVMFSSIVPLYNALIWLTRLIFNDVLLDSLIANVPSIRSFGTALGSLCKHSALEIAPYVSSIATRCNYAREGDFCYEAGNGRSLDIITAMAHVRTMTAALSKIALGVCASAAAPLNIMLFPLMDINLAKGLHNIANSILYTLFQLPSVTAQRCINHGLDPSTKKLRPAGGSILMCLPDFNQPINMLVAGARNLGVLVDNWLDVSSIIAQRTLGLLGKGQADCISSAKSLTPAFYSRQLFGTEGANRRKVVVGLTEGLFAVTDGVHAQYFNHYDSVESIASPYVWPIEIDTSFGVAAVTYRAGTGSEDRDSMGEATTTMLGCRFVSSSSALSMQWTIGDEIELISFMYGWCVTQVHRQRRTPPHAHTVRAWHEEQCPRSIGHDGDDDDGWGGWRFQIFGAVQRVRHCIRRGLPAALHCRIHVVCDGPDQRSERALASHEIQRKVRRGGRERERETNVHTRL
jgi:hypothetical protein